MAERHLRLAAIAYAGAVAVHFADHLRRGIDASPRVVLVLGGIAFVFQALAVGSVLTGRTYAAAVAFAVALPNAVGVTAVHLLPRWSGVSDAFPGADRAPGVTAFSWATAVAEVVTGLVLAYVARRAMNAARPGAPAGDRASATIGA